MMMLSEPQESDYDLRFSAFGFPVRVSWTFWIGAFVIGFDFAESMDSVYADSPGTFALWLVCTLCMFLSIWIHELGHTFAFQYYGIRSSIVLYHFGGLAIPKNSFLSVGSRGSLNYKQQIVVSLAGPVAQLLSAVVVVLIVKMLGYQVDAFLAMPAGLNKIPWVAEGNPIDSVPLYTFVYFYIWVSVMWALLNLMPVWPLDGGQICRNVMLLNGGTEIQSLWISVISAALLAAWAISEDNTFMAIFFGLFALSSYQMLQQPRGWR